MKIAIFIAALLIALALTMRASWIQATKDDNTDIPYIVSTLIVFSGGTIILFN